MTNPDHGQHFATRARAEKKSLTFFREAGRGKALVHINNLVKFNPGLVLLMGEEGSGRSRVLKQFAESLKGKTGRMCILEQAIKNENQLYTAIADGFALDHVPGDNLKSIQQEVRGFLERNVATNKPIIIALDDVQRCSLAMLEALIELQAKFKQMSLILIGDNSLQEMLRRLQGGKVAANPVLLSSLDAREIRQYLGWRLPFQLTDLELTNIANLSRGNLALLEQEALKRESSYQQKNSHKSENSLFSGLTVSRQSMQGLLAVIFVACAVGIGYVLYQDESSRNQIANLAGKATLVSRDLLSQIPGLHSEATEVTGTNTQVRSNEAWVERQISLLNQNDESATPSNG